MTAATVHTVRTAPPLALAAVGAGAAYFAATFLGGFGFGYVRETFVAPFITSDLAVVVEAPLMAYVVWRIARLVVGWVGARAVPWVRLVIGVVGLGLLVASEDLLSRLLRGESIFEHWGWMGYLAATATFAGLGWMLFAPLRAARPLAARQGSGVDLRDVA